MPDANRMPRLLHAAQRLQQKVEMIARYIAPQQHRTPGSQGVYDFPLTLGFRWVHRYLFQILLIFITFDQRSNDNGYNDSTCAVLSID